MAIDATPATTAASQSLNLQSFMRILLKQLQYQDPLKPMDNQQFMAQMAQFTTLQQTQEMNSKLSTLITNQSALQSVGLIGRTVDFRTDAGTSASGQVSSISLVGETPQIMVSSGSSVPLAVNISQITAVR